MKSDALKSDAFRQGLLEAVQTDASGFTRLCYNGAVKEPLGSDGGLDVLKRIVRTTPKLAELRLPNCKLGVIGAAHLAVPIALDQTLVILDLSRNSLKTEGALHVARAIKNCSIEKVFLGDNGIDSSSPELWQLLLQGPRVVSLFGNRDIKSKGVMDMVAVMESGNCKCRKLDLGDCGIKQAAGEAVVTAVAALTTMKAIVLEKNDFGLRLSLEALPTAPGQKKDKRKTNRYTLMAGTSEAGGVGGVGSGSGGAGAGGSSSALGTPLGGGGSKEDPSAAFLALMRSTSLTEIKVPFHGTPEMQEVSSKLVRMTATQNAALEEVSARDRDGILMFKGRMWRSVPEQVLKPTWVTVLDLRKNFLSGLPYSITALKSLTVLDVSSNLIDSDSVPLHLATLNKLSTLSVNDNPFVTWQVDPQTPSVSMVAMKMLGEERVPCSFLKAIVIGQEAVGKTTLVDTLYRSLNDEGLMKHQLAKWKKRFQERKEGRHWTDGIEICQTMLPNADPNGAPLTLSIWDFAGQAVYYPTHQLFLPDKAVFIVVFDLSSPPSMARVHYWLDSIASNVKNPSIVLVGTHKDKCNNWEELCETVRAKHASRRDLDIKGVFAIRATQMGDMGPIKQALQNVAASPKMKEWIGKKFPRSYTFLASLIREENLMTRNPITSRSEFRKVAASCNIVTESDFEECLSWLSYVGVIMMFPRLLALREQIFLSPNWLVSVMSRLVTWRSDAVAAVVGTVFDDDIPVLWPTKYFPEHLRETIISLLTHFEILHSLTESDNPAGATFQRVFIVPCMLSEEEPVFASPGLVGRTFVRRFAFSFAPFGMFPQLLIRMMALCRVHLQLWKWGMVGILRASGSRHLVRVRGSFDASGKGDVDFTITTNDESGLVLHIIISPFESLLRSCYPNAKPRRFVPKPGTQELLEVGLWMQDDKLAVNENSEIALHAPDLALQSTLQVNASELELGPELGRGGFGTICKAKFKGRDVVVKQLLEADSGSAYQELLRECWMMSFLDHVNVIALLGVCLTPLSIVMELANSGDLRLFLDTHSKDLPMFVRLKLLVDIASGMNYAHSQTPPIVHCDLKSPNILVQRDDEGVLTAKIADLGLATVFAYALKHEAADNPRWLAPEAIRGEKISRKVDVYSFAIIMWETLTGKFPFAAEETQYPFSYQFANAVANGLRPSIDDAMAVPEVPSLFVPLMDRSWAAEPSARPTFLECLQLLYQMTDQMLTPPLYQSKHATVSQLGVINCSSLSYVDQVVSWGGSEEVSVLHSDGLLAHYQIVDGQLLWSANLREETSAGAAVGDNFFMCSAGGGLWVCNGRNATVNVYGSEGVPTERTTSTMRSVCEMVSSGTLVVWAGQSNSQTGGYVLEVYSLETEKKVGGSPANVEFRTLFNSLCLTAKRPRRLTNNSAGSQLPPQYSCAWFLQQDTASAQSSMRVADSLVQLNLETGECNVVKSVKAGAVVFAVAVDDVVWAFDVSGAVSVYNAGSRELEGVFALHQPILNAIYVPAIHRVLAISRNQSVCIVDPEFKTVRVAVGSVPVAFGLASRALCLVKRGKLGQILVGGEAVCIFKVHNIKQSAATALVRPTKPLPSKSLENDLSSIKKLDAMSFNSASLTLSSRASVAIPDAMESIIRDLATSTSSRRPSICKTDYSAPAAATASAASETSARKNTHVLKRQESAMIDEAGFESMIRDLQQPMQNSKQPVSPGMSPASTALPMARTASRPSKPLPAAPVAAAAVAAAVSPATAPLLSPRTSTVSTQSPRTSAPASPAVTVVSSGTKIRCAYQVKDKVRVRPSAPGEAFAFRIEADSALIGWARKEDDMFVFMDMTGEEVLRLTQAEMESAKKPATRPTSVVTAKPPPPQHPAPVRPVAPPRPNSGVPRSNAAPRKHLMTNPEVQEMIFLAVRRYEQERLMLQFGGWANVFENMADVNVRYELACKLYFEFLNPDAANPRKLPLSPRVYESLVGVLRPLMDADDFESLCELPQDFFRVAVTNMHEIAHENMFVPCMKEMRERLKVLERQAEQHVMTREESKELSALAICVRLTFDEFLAIVVKYRDVPARRPPPPPSSPVPIGRPTPSGSGANTPKPAMPFRMVMSRGSDMHAPSNSSSSSRHGSLGSEDDAPRPPARLAENPLSACSGARHKSVRAPTSRSVGDALPRHGSVGSESDAPPAPPRLSGRSARESGSEYVIPVRATSSGGIQRSEEFGAPVSRGNSSGNVVRESQHDEYVIAASPRSVSASANNSPRLGLQQLAARKAPPNAPTTPTILSPPPRSPPSRISTASGRSQSVGRNEEL